MSKQAQKEALKAAVYLAHLREEQWRIVESDDPNWDRWNEIENEIEASKEQE